MLTEYWIEILSMCGLAILMYRRPMISLTNILNFYWIVYLVGGLLLYPISSILVPEMDTSLLSKAVWLNLLGFALYTVGVFQYRVTRFAVSRDSYKIQFASLIRDKVDAKSRIPWIAAIVCGIMLFITFIGVGYVPLFAGQTHITKYFQEDLTIFVRYRPIYTFAINTLSIVLTFALVMIVQARKRFNWIILAGLCLFLLVLTAKRGPMFLPILYIGVAYAIIRQNVKILFASAGLLMILGVSMNIGISGKEDLLQAFLVPLSAAAFSELRELNRLLTHFDGELLYGKTYLAGLLSFIPTEWFEFKSQYNYMRYIMALQGVDPSLSGGMRSGYIGEALINFGIVGVGIISYLFGLLVGYVDNWFLSSRWIASRGLIGIIMGIAVFQVGIMAFFASGSSAILFFINRISILALLIFFCIPKTFRNDQSAPLSSVESDSSVPSV